MSSKRPSKGSQAGAETPRGGKPSAGSGGVSFEAEVSAFAAGVETSAGGPDSAPDAAHAAAVNTGSASGATGPAAPNPGTGSTPYTTRVNVTNRVLSELQNIGTFPALGSSPYAAGGGSGAQAPLQRTVEQALQSVLGRLPRGGDHKSFVAALNMSFTYKEDASGRRSYEWTPRTYIGKTDLGGGVTGAQASLVTFAQSAYDNSIRLLDDLYSLIPDTDEQEVEASIAIVRSLWTEFVNELGKEGGPRAARADSLSQTLLGEAGSPTSAANCQLTRLGVLLGLVSVNQTTGAPLIANGRPQISRAFVVTTEEETNLTNFVSMSDYMYSAQAAWKNYLLNFFQKDLGTGLVLLARLLSVLAETVDEVYAAMDSVYIGPAERLTIRVGVPQGKDLSVEELLSWVHTFATEEAPLLIQDGGRRGVEAIIPTATLLRQLMAQFFVNVRNEAEERTRRDSVFNDFLDDFLRPPAEESAAPQASAAARRPTLAPGAQPQALPVGMTQPRVLNPLKDVYRYLDELLRTATDITTG